MILWRLSIARYAEVFDGGYGLYNDGRWNSRGNRITYTATSPALCVLEKLVHIEDVSLMPPFKMVRYDVPDDLAIDELPLEELPPDWTSRSTVTQRLGDDWLRRTTAPLMKVPSVVLLVQESPDVNVLVNHARPQAARIAIRAISDFRFDGRLLG